MTKSATREAADEVSAPIASPVFTGNVGVGVAPEAWRSPDSVLPVGGTGYGCHWNLADSVVLRANHSQTWGINSNSYQRRIQRWADQVHWY